MTLRCFAGLPLGRYRHLTTQERDALYASYFPRRESYAHERAKWCRGGPRVLLVAADGSRHWVDRDVATFLISEGLHDESKLTPFELAVSRLKLVACFDDPLARQARRALSALSSEPRARSTSNQPTAKKEVEPVKNLKEVASALRRIAKGNGPESELAKTALAVLQGDDDENDEGTPAPATLATYSGERGLRKRMLDEAMGVGKRTGAVVRGNTLILG
jgi:hypothetical protein